MPGGQHVKNPAVRARTNRTSTRATLTERSDDDIDIPKLPIRKDPTDGRRRIPWRPETLEWWNDVWSSPMSSEFHESDRHGLFRVAHMIDAFWAAPFANSKLNGEIRLALKDYGFTPMDRRRLEWTIESAKKATDEGARRRAKPAQQQPVPSQDPRLRIV